MTNHPLLVPHHLLSARGDSEHSPALPTDSPIPSGDNRAIRHCSLPVLLSYCQQHPFQVKLPLLAFLGTSETYTVSTHPRQIQTEQFKPTETERESFGIETRYRDIVAIFRTTNGRLCQFSPVFNNQHLLLTVFNRYHLS